jgi:IS5 family transposase
VKTLQLFFMLSPQKSNIQLGFFSSFVDILSQKHPLFILTGKINWAQFDTAFSSLYCATNGRPAKPIRLMVGLLLLKHIRNISDESVVEQWSENNYYQYFCGETSFVPVVPCEASELVHFRNRIGVEGMELIFKESIRINGQDAMEDSIKVDTTVQEKNSTFPTDSKLHRKIIKKCQGISELEQLPVRQSYARTLKKLGVEQRFRSHPKHKAKARKADRKVKTIAGRLVREVERNLTPNSIHHDDITLFKKVLSQTKESKNKIYSLHEPHVNCIAKGKEHKKYEFGNKVSISVTENTGVIVGARSFSTNPYDGHTLEEVIKQYKSMLGKVPKHITADRGYKGKKQIDETTIHTPAAFSKKQLTTYQQNKERKRFRRRAAIEPVIGHLKVDHRLSRNFYKGIKGDEINVLLSAAAFNFKRMINKWKKSIYVFFQNLFFQLQSLQNFVIGSLQVGF